MCVYAGVFVEEDEEEGGRSGGGGWVTVHVLVVAVVAVVVSFPILVSSPCMDVGVCVCVPSSCAWSSLRASSIVCASSTVTSTISPCVCVCV